MIERYLFVKTDMFEAATPGAHFINPRCFGEDFAAWLREKLVARQYSIDTPIQEDWGWVLLARVDGSVFTIAIGIMDESIGKVPAQWRLSISYEKGLNGIKGWFRAVPMAKLEQLFDALRGAVTTEPRFVVSEEE